MSAPQKTDDNMPCERPFDSEGNPIEIDRFRVRSLGEGILPPFDDSVRQQGHV